MTDKTPEEIEALKARAVRMATPDGYAETFLGLRLHPKQKAVLKDLFRPQSRVVLRCGNEVGKTAVCVCASILYAVDMLGAVVVSTAGVYRQVSEQLIPYLKSYAHLYSQDEFRFLDTGIKRWDASKHVWIDAYVGFSATDEHGFQGFHATAERPLLVIIDESQGVAPDIFRAAEDRCNPTFFLACGSPGDPSGMFYEMETSLAKHYTHHKITRFDCLKEHGWWLDREAIERLIAKHGEDNPFIRSTVYGEFSNVVADAMISLGEYEKCENNPPVFDARLGNHWACDFAAGRDKNVLAQRQGNKVVLRKKWVDKDTMSAVGEFARHFLQGQREVALKPDEISGDGDGLGKPMIHRLREIGWNINEFHGGAKERFGYGYRNAISEAWGEGVKKIKACEVILPRDPDLKAQILGRKAKPNSSGELDIEKKEDYKKRCGESPDEADAFFMALMPTPKLTPQQLVAQPHRVFEDWSGQQEDSLDGVRTFFS